MYVRMVQIRTKGKASDLGKKMIDQALPLLRQQPGFIDALALTSDTEPDQFVGMSVWKNKEDADKYSTGVGRQIVESLNSLFQEQPSFRGFNLEASTFHNIGISRSA